MARIELEGLSHRYDPAAAPALHPLDIAFEDGGAYALLGPSGCGKTTLLSIMSGLLTPSQGRVLIAGKDVTAEPPHRRNVAQVFQFPVVYGTMTVFDNLAFPLRNRGVPEPEVATRVQEIAKLLELEIDLKRRAAALPAHRKQTLSLGRGLVRRDVAAILLDEPLTVVDPQLKWTLRRQLKAVHQQMAVTLVYVTHDQTEALTFADRVLVMDSGSVVQQGTPRELFEEPADPFVGRFIGSPGMNLLSCRIDGAAAVVAGQRIMFHGSVPGGDRHVLGIRPEFVRAGDENAEGALRVVVTSIEDLGRHRLVTARAGEETLLAKIEDGPLPPVGDAWLSLPQRWTKVFAATPSHLSMGVTR